MEMRNLLYLMICGVFCSSCSSYHGTVETCKADSGVQCVPVHEIVSLIESGNFDEFHALVNNEEFENSTANRRVLLVEKELSKVVYLPNAEEGDD